MSIDDEGREYKECSLCGKRFYRDNFKNLNQYNWELKKYCNKKHKVIATCKYQKKWYSYNPTLGGEING